jgi:hypothetical protein
MVSCAPARNFPRSFSPSQGFSPGWRSAPKVGTTPREVLSDAATAALEVLCADWRRPLAHRGKRWLTVASLSIEVTEAGSFPSRAAESLEPYRFHSCYWCLQEC